MPLTPEAFLIEVRSRRLVPYWGAPDEELLELTKRDLEALGETLPGPAEALDLVAARLAEEIKAACIALWGTDLSERCAIGALPHPAVNAQCIRSGVDGVYALVIYHGLMMLLHKYTKLIVAAHDTTQVVYCNRKEPDALEPGELLAWAAELGLNYLDTGAPRGAILKLTPRAMAAVVPIVHLGELFVLGHEAGHYLAGHLDTSSFHSSDDDAGLEVLTENENHAYEFEADALGFEIMRACAGDAPAEHIRSATVAAFSMMGLIGGDVDTVRHPASSTRYRHLAERYGAPLLGAPAG